MSHFGFSVSIGIRYSEEYSVWSQYYAAAYREMRADWANDDAEFVQDLVKLNGLT